MMKLLKYAILILVFWLVPTYTLFYVSSAAGSAASFLTIALMLLYYFLLKQKEKLLMPFLLLGLFYYTISGLNYDGLEDKYFYRDFIKFVIVVICGGEIVKNTTIKELYIILIFGAMSIICHGVFFPNVDVQFGAGYGRFSGFYLNPNTAAVICLVGFSLSYGVNNTKLKLLGQLVFTLAGILTLSRTFIALWLLMNLMSVIVRKKNIVAPLIGAAVLIFVLIFSSLQLNTDRFGALQSIFSSNQRVKTEIISKDSRTHTWGLYTDIIFNKPFFGHGYGKMKGGHFGLTEGVHNSYLMILGEAGLLPLLVLLYIIGFSLIQGFRDYKSKLHYFLLAVTVSSFLLASHMFFDIFFYVFITMFLYSNLNTSMIENENK